MKISLSFTICLLTSISLFAQHFVPDASFNNANALNYDNSTYGNIATTGKMIAISDTKHIALAQREDSSVNGRRAFIYEIDASTSSPTSTLISSTDPTFNEGTFNDFIIDGAGDLFTMETLADSTVPSSPLNARIVISKYNLSMSNVWTLDNSFGSSGKFEIPTSGNIEHGFRLLSDSNGAVLVFGHRAIGTSYRIFIKRIASNGSIDSNWGGSGIVLLNTNSWQLRVDVVKRQSNGKILVAYQDAILSGPSQYNYYSNILRLNTDGTLDNTFAPFSNNIRSLPWGSPSTAGGIFRDIYISDQGSIFISGTGNFAPPQPTTTTRGRISVLDSVGDFKTGFASLGNYILSNDNTFFFNIQKHPTEGIIILGLDTFPKVYYFNENGLDAFFHTPGYSRFDTIDSSTPYLSALSNGKILINYDIVNAQYMPSVLRYTYGTTTQVIETEIQTFAVFPNPAKTIINIDFEENTKFQILNTLGQVIKSDSGQSNYRVNIEGLDCGVYYILTEKGQRASFIKT